jgi:crossover junction endodeoxyribonuclease RuvC
MNLILGIDPGLSGALAYYNIQTKQPVHVQDMPVTSVKDKNRINFYTLATLIDQYAKQTKFAIIEEVSGGLYGNKTTKDGKARTQGVTSAFNFGNAFGIATGVVAANMIPIFFVKPGVWKLNLGLTSDKQKSLDKAIEMWPSFAHLLSRKKDNGRAEAMLLAFLGTKLKG